MNGKKGHLRKEINGNDFLTSNKVMFVLLFRQKIG